MGFGQVAHFNLTLLNVPPLGMEPLLTEPIRTLYWMSRSLTGEESTPSHEETSPETSSPLIELALVAHRHSCRVNCQIKAEHIVKEWLESRARLFAKEAGGGALGDDVQNAGIGKERAVFALQLMAAGMGAVPAVLSPKGVGRCPQLAAGDATVLQDIGRLAVFSEGSAHRRDIRFSQPMSSALSKVNQANTKAR